MKHLLMRYSLKSSLKRHISVLAAVILLFMLIPVTGHANGVTASKNTIIISVDGSDYLLDAYNIGNYNYFKLRDIAYILSGTEKQFDVTWDGSKKTINLLSGKSYTAVGNELSVTHDNIKKTAIPNTSSILLDGKEIKLTAYSIDGYNYFKLRDLATVFDFYVEWDSYYGTIIIETIFGYVPENAGDSYSFIRNINVSNTQVNSISNWAQVSPVQQFLYMDEGLAYAYAADNQLRIVTPGKTLSIEMKYPLLGDVISDDEGNFYVVWGKVGTKNTEKTIFISKYSPKGEHIKTTGFVGISPLGADGNTKIPFDAGNCVSAIHEGVLMVNYAREMYNGHQSNNVIGVYTEDMSPYSFDLYYWDEQRAEVPYVSHSFNQSIIYSKIADDFVLANHGDAYDRGFIVEKLNKKVVRGYTKTLYETIYSQLNIFHFYLEPKSNYNMYVVNKTFAQLGGLAETSKGVVLVGASAKSIGEAAKTEKQNLFIQIFDPLATEVSPSMFVGGTVRSGETSLNIYDTGDTPLTKVTDYGVIWLTNHTDRDVIAPQVVVGEDRIIILWTEVYKYTPESFYMVLAADGEVITPATSLGRLKLNSYEMPVYHNGFVYWAYVDNGKLRVVSIPVNE